MTHLLAQHRELVRDILLDARLVRDDFNFLVGRRIGELDRHESVGASNASNFFWMLW